MAQQFLAIKNCDHQSIWKFNDIFKPSQSYNELIKTHNSIIIKPTKIYECRKSLERDSKKIKFYYWNNILQYIFNTVSNNIS